ncbi:MAG: sigma-70 family RNA polymerase sigma factor [Myxococcaceae bacterium]|nr:sigma-70 family RNA polymerase sigma factor [Myxococcaceae bacterium]
MSGGVDRNGKVSDLYRKYGPVIYSRCRRLLKDDALAEDATQEVFVRVMRHIEAAPDDAAALAWIYRISTNYCLNQIRDRSRQAEPMEELPEQVGEHPEGEMLDRDLAMQLVQRAPENLRAPAVLYYVDGLEQEQVAKALGISRRTVINRLNEFMSRSRKFLARGAA